MPKLTSKIESKGRWLSVAAYAKKHGVKHPQSLYIQMLKNQVKWREIEVKVKRKQILDK